MTTANPKHTPSAQSAQPQARPLTPEQRLQNILKPEAKPAGKKGNDILSDGRNPKAQPKSQPAKLAPNAKPATKAAPQGQADADEDILDGQATSDDEDSANLAEGDDTDQAKPDTDASDEDGEPVDDAGEEGETEDEEPEATYKVKVNGEELEVPLSELLKGYSRTADYQQKTAAVAKERKEVEALKETVKDLPQQRETYVKGAERFGNAAVIMLRAMQEKFMPKPPSPELAQTDPAAYFAQKEACQEAMQFTGALQMELQNIQGNLKKDEETNHLKAVQESRKRLYEAMPDMAQPVARQKLREYSNSLGFTDEQIARETNHVLFVCVEKARRWDELQAQKANTKPKAPIQKVVRRSNAPETKRAVQQRDKQAVFSEHKNRGTVKSAEKALMAIFSE